MQMPPHNHKDRNVSVQQHLIHESWRYIARRTLFFVILFIILFAIVEHNRLRNSCEGGRWRVVDGEVMCVHSPDTPAAGQ